MGLGDQLVAGKKLKEIPGFLASAKGWDGSITQGRLDLGVKLRGSGLGHDEGFMPVGDPGGVCPMGS